MLLCSWGYPLGLGHLLSNLLHVLVVICAAGSQPAVRSPGEAWYTTWGSKKLFIVQNQLLNRDCFTSSSEQLTRDLYVLSLYWHILSSKSLGRGWRWNLSFTAFSTMEQFYLAVEAAKTSTGKRKMDAGGLSITSEESKNYTDAHSF